MRKIAPIALALGCVVACGPSPAPKPIPAEAQLDGGVAVSPSVAPPDAGPGGATSPCEGATVNLLAAIADPACRISEAEADRLREVLEDSAKTPLRVAATVTDGALRQVIIVNTGTAPAVLPLVVQDHRDAFPAMAGSLVLAPPVPAWPAQFSSETGRVLARVVLPPGGRAFANVRLDFSKLAVVGRGPLPPGEYTLRFRTPLYATRKDLEARVRRTTGPACPGPAPCPPGQVSVHGCYGGMAPRPGDCPPANRCVPANVVVPECPPVP